LELLNESMPAASFEYAAYEDPVASRLSARDSYPLIWGELLIDDLGSGSWDSDSASVQQVPIVTTDLVHLYLQEIGRVHF